MAFLRSSFPAYSRKPGISLEARCMCRCCLGITKWRQQFNVVFITTTGFCFIYFITACPLNVKTKSKQMSTALSSGNMGLFTMKFEFLIVEIRGVASFSKVREMDVVVVFF